jgi:hypothetical protein|tara:strand:- start:1203 stop:1421 length:219 start_codon:yes stop_codon:yes gene_type:complete
MTNFAAAGQVQQEMIPVIDVSPALDGSDVGRVAEQIHRAATETGFSILAGMGLILTLLRGPSQLRRISSPSL